MGLEGFLTPTQVLEGNLQKTQVLKGELTQVSNLIKGTISSTGSLTGNIILENATLKGELSIPVIPGADIDVYKGEYHVIPLAFRSQTLETEGLKMLGDVVVEKIPYWETSNLSDGYTVYIAEA